MGSGMGKYLLEKEGIEIVGVICSTERENGMDLGVLLVTKINGIICSNNANAVLKTPADIILIRSPRRKRWTLPELALSPPMV